MKKYVLSFVLMMCLLLVPTVPTMVYALDETVTISSALATADSVTVSGTTAATAVMVQVRDADNNVLAMESFPVVAGSFTGTIDSGIAIACETTYKVYVADYEGGDWATKDFSVAHSYGAYVYNNDATCEADGTMTATCSACGKKDTVADPAHKATGHVDVNPKDSKCDVCGKVLEATGPTPAPAPEKQPAEETVKTPGTGDRTAPIVLYVAIGVAAAAMVGMVLVRKKK